MPEVIVSGLALDAKNNSPVIILKEKEGERILPIWIGVFEANAIAMELGKVNFKRPLTYDLFNSVLFGLDAKITKVSVCEIKENTYFAKIFIQTDKRVVEIDARPSDSIALALKTQSPIFVEETVMNSALAGEKGEKKYSPEDLQKRLKEINPEDFGDFKL